MKSDHRFHARVKIKRMIEDAARGNTTWLDSNIDDAINHIIEAVKDELNPTPSVIRPAE